MLFWTILKVGLKSLVASPMRSFLTMLGIIIGVGAVIAMLAMGAGAQKSVMSRITAMGTNLLIVRPGQSESRGVFTGVRQNLTVADALAIRDEAEGVRLVSPVVSRNAQVKYMNRNANTRVTGISTTYLPIRDYQVEKGRLFTEREAEGTFRVAIIGPVTAEKLFGQSEGVDETIKINGVNFRVVGITKAKGDQGFFSSDDLVFVPYETGMKQLFGMDFLGEIDVQANDGADMIKVQDQITAVLRKRHRIAEGRDNDFEVRNQADIIDTAKQATGTFGVLLGGIGGISLLVGGIGIMNIMLVTVTERTREIGIRKAIGAKERSIMVQFLVESVIISGLGGLLGVAAGVGGAHLIEVFTRGTPLPFVPVVDVSSVLMALLFSAFVGIFFGFYPALRAARLDPVVALRYE